jgi:hypothetical protein
VQPEDLVAAQAVRHSCEREAEVLLGHDGQEGERLIELEVLGRRATHGEVDADPPAAVASAARRAQGVGGDESLGRSIGEHPRQARQRVLRRALGRAAVEAVGNVGVRRGDVDRAERQAAEPRSEPTAPLALVLVVGERRDLPELDGCPPWSARCGGQAVRR